MRADMAPEKVLKKRKRRHPGLRPERRGFPGNLKFPRMESRPELPKNRWERDLGKRSRRENRQKAGRQNMRPQQTRGLGKSRPDRPDKEKPEKNGGKEEDLLPLSGCGIWGAALPDASQRRAISFLLREGLAYLKKLCPHLTKADVDYSLGDPAWTGELTGIISLWPGVYGKNIHFRPDFESDGIYFRGYVQLESEIYFWQLAFLLLKIYRNEDCRRLFDL